MKPEQYPQGYKLRYNDETSKSAEENNVFIYCYCLCRSMYAYDS